MRNIINSFLILVVLAYTAQLTTAQTSSFSPYSRYGLSFLDDAGFSQNSGLAGSGIALRSPLNINALNPASLSALDSMTVLFEAGILGQYTSLSDGINTENSTDGNFQYIAMAFPIISNHWGSSFGIKPYSFVGYSYREENDIDGVGKTLSIFQGSGGYNQIYWANSLKLFKNLSVGLSISYLYGKVNHDRRILSLDNPLFITATSNRSLSLSNILYETGLQYTLPLKDAKSITWGAIFSPGLDITGDYYELISASDTISDRKKQQLKLPVRIGTGISYQNSYRWLLTADYTFEQWDSGEFIKRNNRLTDKHKVSMGVEFLNNPFSKNIFKRTKYRMGVKYINSNIIVNDVQVNEYGMTFGLGLPLANLRSTLNVACELGRRGSLSGGLVRENYAKLHLSFSLYDLWFHKRQFE